MIVRLLLAFFIHSLLLISYSFAEASLRYVPIGDSYTIGNGVEEHERWPNQLATLLHKRHGVKIEVVANPARSGWTATHVLAYEMKEFRAAKPDFATLLIGTNDLVRGITRKDFAARLSLILDDMQAAISDKQKIILLTLPDYSATPRGAMILSPEESLQGLRAFNEVIVQEAKKRELPVVDLFHFGKRLQANSEMLIGDGLHPSAAQYTLWAEAIEPVAKKLLISSNH